jgi:hypothetical protein
MTSWANPRHRKAEAVLACLAVFALLFMVTESSLDHHHAGSSDATCPVCHIAHNAPIQTAVCAAKFALLSLSFLLMIIPPAHLLLPNYNQVF